MTDNILLTESQVEQIPQIQIISQSPVGPFNSVPVCIIPDEIAMSFPDSGNREQRRKKKKKRSKRLK